MILRRPFWVLFFTLIGCSIGAWITRAVIYYRLIYVCFLLIAGSYVWTHYSVKGVQVRRTARLLRQQVGQIFIEQFEVLNQSPLIRIWLEIEDLTPMSGKNGSTVMSWLGPNQRRMYATHTQLHERGLFPLGPTKITSGDPFGLFTNSKLIPAIDNLVVLPYLARIQVLPSPAGFLAGGRVTGRKSLETTPQAMGVRDYQPGDSLNQIHWRTTARKGQLMVKEFDQDPRADVWIFLDAEKRNHVKEPDQRLETDPLAPIWRMGREKNILLAPDSFEYSISAAGSIADYYIDQGRAVGYASYGQALTVLSAETGGRQHSRILDHLAFVQCEGRMDLLGLVQAQAPNLVRGSIVVLITTTGNHNIPYLVDALLHWRMSPVLIIADLTSFGVESRQSMNCSTDVQQDVPFYLIKKWESADTTNELIIPV